MLITDIAVEDWSTSDALHGQVAMTTETGTHYITHHDRDAAHADPTIRREVLVREALSKLQRIPDNRRTPLTVLLTPALAA